ncbi:unnamed protein product [Vitrella brassicaformis CCMP3155]|uniref:Uncharacterized protein n=1 Tax=Vitrella brassicaformis (strain CCMP3155) TaxID=1169540 RepID=A0A0G4GTE9_VITBC|nr:unnamed protein product [Vitrella brassicaformis CCMP3155]|eukprot:CEM33765.1 unnamed protein product [Vitrella brassicaformis CCMP3155]
MLNRDAMSVAAEALCEALDDELDDELDDGTLEQASLEERQRLYGGTSEAFHLVVDIDETKQARSPHLLPVVNQRLEGAYQHYLNQVPLRVKRAARAALRSLTAILSSPLMPVSPPLSARCSSRRPPDTSSSRRQIIGAYILYSLSFFFLETCTELPAALPPSGLSVLLQTTDHPFLFKC